MSENEMPVEVKMVRGMQAVKRFREQNPDRSSLDIDTLAALAEAHPGETAGYWLLQTPIGMFDLIRWEGGWTADASVLQSRGLEESLDAWLERCGLGELILPTRRELVVVISDAITKFPLD